MADTPKITEMRKDKLEALPDAVAAQLAAHLEMYLRDPEGAHYWDPACIGVPGGPVACLLVEHQGRKSGRTLKNLLQYYKLDGKFAIIASRGGTVEHPHWYLNLVAEPRCVVQIGKERHNAIARTADDTQHQRLWPQVVKEQPVQAEYQARTSRRIPIVLFDFLD
jgi:deazaflavin-dependent oxidoreductase (nitroreductase family)